MIKKLTKDRDFFGPMLSIALPTALQNLIASLLNMIDTVMIGKLGEVEIAGVGLANQVFFLFNFFLFGTYTGANIFIAQFWGEKDTKNIRRILGVALFTGIGISLIFSLVSIIFPQFVLSIFSSDSQVIIAGGQYLRVVAISYTITAITFCFAFSLRCTGDVMLPVIISIIALLVNTTLNYLLIYGHYGFPRLAVRGAALATVIARTVEMVLLLFIIYRKQLVAAAKISELTDFNLNFIRKFFQTTIPVIINETLWALGFTMFTLIYARMGTDVIAGINIFKTIEGLGMVLFYGLAQACAVTVGNKIGAGEEEQARLYARRYSIISPLIAVFIGIIILITANPILSIYKVSEEVLEIARLTLTAFAFVLPIRVFNLINIVGILRSGGDTKFSLLLDTGALWFIAVPLSFVAGLVWHLPPHIVYLVSSIEGIVKVFIGVERLVSGKWLNNLTKNIKTTMETQPRT
jgi:putative MATE family efflux protein